MCALFVHRLQMEELFPSSRTLREWRETEGRNVLITVLSVPNCDYSVDVVWGALRMSHSCLRGTDAVKKLVYYGNQIGEESDMGMCLTVNDWVMSTFKSGCVYVNRYVRFWGMVY